MARGPGMEIDLRCTFAHHLTLFGDFGEINLWK